jgi:hypothetical protein
MHTKKAALAVALAVAVAIAWTATAAHAAPVQLPAQGRLTAQGGGAAADGNYALAVALYDQPQAGTAVFEEAFPAVAVQGGVFSLTLGAGKFVLEDKLLAAGGPLWIGVSVGADELPRVPLLRTPFAVQSSYAALATDVQCSGCVGGDDLQDGSVTAAKIANGAVQAQHAAFNWAAADGPGGAANFALAANNAKLADVAVFADEAASAQKVQCTGCISTNQIGEGAVMTMQLANGSVTAAKLAPAAVQWSAISGTPAGFADGVDDTVTDAAIVSAVQKDPLDLAKGLKVGGAAAARIASAVNDALADKAAMTLDTASGSLAVVAQAWFYDATSKAWLQANAGQAAAAAPCPSCGGGKDGAFNAVSNTTLAGGTYEYTTFTIAKGVTVTVTGTKPLLVSCTGAIDIQGNLLLEGGKGVDVNTTYGGGPFSGGVAGAGGSPGGTGFYGANAESGQGSGGGAGAPTASYGGGGGGASYGTPGSNGGAGNSGTFGNAGNVYGDPLLGSLLGGSGGGAGGYGGAINQGGGGGGGGGGVVRLTGATVSVSGLISANGGNGGSIVVNGDGGAGGGGSGGAIWLRGAKVDITGTVRALGGSGGAKIGGGGPGGAGGQGRIRIDSISAASGVTTPAYAKGDASGLTLPTTNTFAIDQVQPGVVRLTNLTGATQKVQLVVTY